MTQLTLDLPRQTAFGRADFLVSESNAAAVAWIDRWPDWPSPALVLNGPAGSGKTHLAHLWVERASAIMVAGAALDEQLVAQLITARRHRIAIDDGDHAAELPLLHLYNACLEAGGHLLITARQPPGIWRTGLLDLGSRLRAALAIGIGLPDDSLLAALLVKQFADRQLRVAPEVVAYLIRHMERSFAAVIDLAARLDAASLSERRAVGLPLARDLLARIKDQTLPPGSDSGVT